MPYGLLVLYKNFMNLGEDKGLDLMFLCLSTAIAMSVGSTVSTIIAEEKEKKGMNIFGGGKKEEIGKMKVSYVSIIRPKVFEDSRLIADSIKEKKVVTFSLEFLEFEVGQRVIDFVSGAAYAMDAHLSKVTDKVLTSIPNGVGYEDIDTSLEEEKDGSKLL